MTGYFPFEHKPGFRAAVDIAHKVRGAHWHPEDAVLYDNLVATTYDLTLCLSQAWMGDPLGAQQARMVAAKVRAWLELAELSEQPHLCRQLDVVMHEAATLHAMSASCTGGLDH